MNDTPPKDGQGDDDREDINDVLASIRQLVSQEAESHADDEARRLRREAEAEKGGNPDDRTASVQPSRRVPDGPLILGKMHRIDEEDSLIGAGEPDLDDRGNSADESADSPEQGHSKADDQPAGDIYSRSGQHGENDSVWPPVESQAPTDQTPYFDEDALRAMVTDMVREELEGELGERISLNIRKLVRREVARQMDFSTEDQSNIVR